MVAITGPVGCLFCGRTVDHRTGDLVVVPERFGHFSCVVASAEWPALRARWLAMYGRDGTRHGDGARLWTVEGRARVGAIRQNVLFAHGELLWEWRAPLASLIEPRERLMQGRLQPGEYESKGVAVVIVDSTRLLLFKGPHADVPRRSTTTAFARREVAPGVLDMFVQDLGRACEIMTTASA